MHVSSFSKQATRNILQHEGISNATVTTYMNAAKRVAFFDHTIVCAWQFIMKLLVHSFEEVKPLSVSDENRSVKAYLLEPKP